MLISQNIKNIVSGISQQAPILRLPEQLEEQENGLSTEANGLTKRPPTVFIRTLSSPLENDDAPLLHFVDRDENLKYFVYFYKNLVYVYDINGKKYPVIYKEDPGYLETRTPQKSLRVVTIADHTFITNREVITRMSGEHSPNTFETQGVLINVKQGQYGRTYAIWVDGVQVASHETPDGSDKSHTKQIDVGFIVNKLAEQVRAKGYTVDTGSSWLRIRGVKTVKTADGFNNNAMVGFATKAQRFNLLPASAPDGYTLEIAGDPKGDNSGNYYITYDGDGNVWKECVKPDINISFEAQTMPHELVRQANNTFVFQRCTWDKRTVGDEDSNPLPSFINQAINDIAFHRNRLVFLSGENVICSESASYFNFWMTTANDVVDTDPIDVATTTERVNILNYAVPYSGELYCFSDKSQFVVRADGVLSPKNTALVEVTAFESNPACRPTRAGRNLYFSAERSEYSSIKEYYSVQQVSDEKNAQDITSHIPDYIPNGVYEITANTSENIMLVLTTGDKTGIYVYKYLFLNENRVQSSWSRWEMGGRVFGAFFAGSTLYILINRGGRHCLEKMNFTTYTTEDLVGHEPYRVYLDSKKVATTAKYDSTTNTTSFDILSEYNAADVNAYDIIGVVTQDGKYVEGKVTDGIMNLVGAYHNQDVVIGIPYRFHIRLSPIYLHTTTQTGTITVLTGRLQVRYIHLNYANTGGFTVKVHYHGGRECKYVMTARNIGLDTATLGRTPDDTGIFKFPVQALNTNVNIDIDSELPLPLSLVGFMWEGSFVARSRGV